MAKIVNSSGNLSGAIIGNSTILSYDYFFHTEANRLFVSGGTSSFTSMNTLSGTNDVTYSIMNSDLNKGISNKINLNGFGYTNQTANTVVPYSLIPTIGARFNENITAGSEVSEVILFNASKDTGTERQRINSYLAIKYGSTLDQTIPTNYLASDASVIWNANTNVAYKNNIAGIGRDDISGLTQKQSQSVNTGKQIIISLGNSVASTNVLNSNTFNSNHQFLVWGNNNLTGSLTLNDPNNGIFSISKRIFKVQNTGGINQQITLLIPTNMFPGGNVTNLIINTNETFPIASNLILSPVSNNIINGGYYQYSYTPIATNAEFYFAVSNFTAPGGVDSNLNLWVKADFGIKPTATSSPTLVTEWIDQTLNNNFSIKVTPQVVDNKVNFNPTVLFDGSSRFEGDASINSTEAFTVAKIINNPPVVGASGAVLGSLLSNTGNYFFHTYDNILLAGNLTQFVSMEIKPTATIIPYSIMNTNLSEGSSSTIKLNGLAYSNTTGASVTPYNAIPTIGSRGTENLLNGSEISEVILFSTSKSSNYDRQKIHSYLSLKYGLTLGNTSNPISYLASDGTNIWDANISYRNNIIGLALDNYSNLNQQIATSQTDSGDIITLSTNDNFTDSNGKHTPITKDKSFLILGSNGGMTIATTIFKIEKASVNRIGRIWRVQDTNNFNNSNCINVQINAISLPQLNPGESWYILATTNDKNINNDNNINHDEFTANVSFKRVDIVDGFITAKMKFPPNTGNNYFTLIKKDGSNLLSKIKTSININDPLWTSKSSNTYLELYAKNSGLVLTRINKIANIKQEPGMFIYDNSDNNFKVSNGTSWRVLNDFSNMSSIIFCD